MSKLEDLQYKKDNLLRVGGEIRIAKQHASGKLTARERMALLFDPNSFIEIDPFVTHRCHHFGMEGQLYDGDGVVGGYGRIDGRIVFAYSQDFTVLGGSLGEAQANKICKILDMAYKTGSPIVGINDSGGARIQEGIEALAGYGKIFYRNTRASGVVPQITAIMGPCAGGAVYSPALTDFIFMVDKTSKMFITGPSVIKTVTGEEISAEELGGANTHNKKSGVASFINNTEEECISNIRKLLSFLPSNYKDAPPFGKITDDPNRITEKLRGLLPDNPNQPYDMYELIKEIADSHEYFDVMQTYATNIITCFTHFHGRTVGIIANQPAKLAGCIDVNASDKAARFIRFCDAFGIPLLTIVDVPGFLPGVNQEYSGIIRHGAKMLYAYSEATVPKVTLIIRKAYGGAYLAMCCKDMGADIVYAWPNAEIAVMGPEGAANIIFADKKGEERKEKIEEYKEKFANPYIAASRGLVDDVIDPAETRKMIIASYEMLQSKKREKTERLHGNIPL